METTELQKACIQEAARIISSIIPLKVKDIESDYNYIGPVDDEECNFSSLNRNIDDYSNSYKEFMHLNAGQLEVYDSFKDHFNNDLQFIVWNLIVDVSRLLEREKKYEELVNILEKNKVIK